jgi:hypothetical protein
MHMAFELNNRTKILAGLAVLVLAGAGAGWFFFLQDEAPPPRAAAPAKPAAKPAAEAAKGAPDAAKSAAVPAADAAKAVAVAPAAKPGAKPIPKDPDKLIAEVIETSGLKAHFQAFGRETMLKAGAGGQAEERGTSPEDVRAVSGIIERVFEPDKMTAELAANLKAAGNFDAERMARFLELLRQPVALKMTSQEMRNVPPQLVREFSENFRKTPPPAARMKLIQSIDEVTHTSEVAADMTNAMARDMVDAMLESMQKAGKAAPREARQMVGSQLNSMRSQMRGQFRTIMYVMYRNATDEELSEYLKLLDADTGRWGSELLTNAIRPILVSRGSTLGREIAQLVIAKQAMAKQAVAKAPAPPVAKSEEEKAAEKPAAAVAPAPVEQPGYQRPANIREVYTRYNDLISATVMRDRAAVKELLDDGKSPNARQQDGVTPLMVAASNGDADIAAMLLAKGADPTLRAQGGRTALSMAKARGAAGAQMVQLLQRSGARD